MLQISPEANDAIQRLRVLAVSGPIPSVGSGDRSVGMTLLHALGIQQTSAHKSTLNGIVITAQRTRKKGTKNRVNLFARVPNWRLSACKSSADIAEKYGYAIGPNEIKLYCTVTTKQVNPQGLMLYVNRAEGTLDEIASLNGVKLPVAKWSLSDLESQLIEKNPQSFWVNAMSHFVDGIEHFHYRTAIYTQSPRPNTFADLLEIGAVTVDHLIIKKGSRAQEKGPLFKIEPKNFELLFPSPVMIDLMR